MKEKRAYRRFRTALPGRFAGVGVTTANLSIGGAQLVCPALSWGHASGRLDRAREKLELRLGAEGEITLTVRTAYVSESDDEFLVGVEFTEFQGDARRRLARHVSRAAGSDYTRERVGAEADEV